MMSLITAGHRPDEPRGDHWQQRFNAGPFGGGLWASLNEPRGAVFQFAAPANPDNESTARPEHCTLV
jgi:hypothetical protein